MILTLFVSSNPPSKTMILTIHKPRQKEKDRDGQTDTSKIMLGNFFKGGVGRGQKPNCEKLTGAGPETEGQAAAVTSMSGDDNPCSGIC